MKTLKVTFFDSVDEIIRKAKGKFGENTKFAFARFPDGSLRLIVKGKNGEKGQCVIQMIADVLRRRR